MESNVCARMFFFLYIHRLPVLGCLLLDKLEGELIKLGARVQS